MSAKDNNPVIIIGAGPTGTALAIDLALHDTPSILIERHQKPQQIPKGQNLTQRTGEHLRYWGVTDEIRGATLIPREYGNEGLVAYGNLLSEYHYDWFKRGTVREFYAADNERLPQFETERILRERAAQFDCITTHYGWSYSACSQNDENVTVSVEETGGSGKKELIGSYLVGCDGARSAVRESASINFAGSGTQRRMALLVFHSPQLHELLESRYPGKTIFNVLEPSNEGYWQFFGRVDLNSNWFFHAPVPTNASLDDYDFQTLLNDAVGCEVPFTLNYKGFWDLRFSHADSYRYKKIFIAGDAAHNHPPYGGYGVNTGFEDTRNLSWKLTACLQGWGSEALLDSYTAERHPVFASTRDDFILRMVKSDAEFLHHYSPETDLAAFSRAWNERATQGQREVAGFVPHYAGSPIVVNPDQSAVSGATGQHSHSACAGGHLSPQTFDDLDRLFDVSAQDKPMGFMLLTPPDGESVAQQFKNVAKQCGVPLEIVSVDKRKSNPDPDDIEQSLRCVLLRPDNFIAWVEPDSDRTRLLGSGEIASVLMRCAGLR